MIHRISLFLLVAGFAGSMVGCQSGGSNHSQFGQPGHGPHVAGYGNGGQQSGDPFANSNMQQQGPPQQQYAATQHGNYSPQGHGRPQQQMQYSPHMQQGGMVRMPSAAPQSVQSTGGNTVVQAGHEQPAANPFSQYQQTQSGAPAAQSGWQPGPSTQQMPITPAH